MLLQSAKVNVKKEIKINSEERFQRRLFIYERTAVRAK